ncbi:unnamed protein product [Cylindrotheca closterium]|uniref:Uncharacterized protein n=1 Tax=Cylindrotheca closterium TaxID=2856 RepID=A0AAD2G1C3_9STRA|nr:unnamed protein product [Cylindrotheca closterium]
MNKSEVHEGQIENKIIYLPYSSHNFEKLTTKTPTHPPETMMRQYFQNLAAETGVSQMTLVGDKASLPYFGPRRTSLSISFASSSKASSTSSSKKFLEVSEDDFAPSFPTRKLSSGSLTSLDDSSSSGDDDDNDDDSQLSNSRWVSTPTTRSKSYSPVSLTRKSLNRKNSGDLLAVGTIKSVFLRDIINAPTAVGGANEEATISTTLLTPPKRKESIEDSLFCLHNDTAGSGNVRRSRSADLVAPLVFHKCL